MPRCSRAAALALALAVGVSPPSARAQVLTGNELLQACQTAGDAGVGFCSGYVIGVLGGMRLGAFLVIRVIDEDVDVDGVNTFSDAALSICDPGGANNQQVVDIAVRHLIDNPSTRHQSARALVQEALAAAFPCEAAQ